MLRILRIAGIVVFALLVGISAHSLYRQYRSGELYEQYNSQRKASITLLSMSILSVIALGSAEVVLSRKSSGRRGYGSRHYREDDDHAQETLDAANIYSSPKTVDPWNGRRIRQSKKLQKPSKHAPERWMGIVRIYCSILPLVYAGACAFICMGEEYGAMEHWVLPSLFSCFFLISLLVAVGVFCKKAWGLSLGYLLAILNLLIFPYGTALGLLLIIGLVGAAPFFADHESRQRRKARSVSV